MTNAADLPPRPAGDRFRYQSFAILAALVALTVAAYWQVGSAGWIGYDDPSYVTTNPMVNLGLREASFYWAFTATHGANWHPLTSLSHLLDCTLFGLDPAPPHWENVLWHALNTTLVFLVWRRLSGATWPSALVAALFALHPLHVESVAWISERKDVLSTACWLLAIGAYARWVEKPTRGRYAAVAGCFALGLMAKPMTVTLPFTLLLLDYWPLRRWPVRSWGALGREKLPLFALAATSSVITAYVQHDAGATDYGQSITFPMRLGNAVVAYLRYLGKMLWPSGLSCFYPHPGWWPSWAILGSLVLLGMLSWLVWRERETRRWLAFGWCWYLGTLVPVIGLMQVGAQSIADRYTYVPLLGIFTAVAWAGAELIERRPQFRPTLIIAASIALAACFFRTIQQVPVWSDPLVLVENMHAVIGDHPVVFRERATALSMKKRPGEEIIDQYRRGYAMYPEYPHFLTELGLEAGRTGRFPEAYRYLERVRDLVPHDSGVYHNLGNTLLKERRLEDAERLLRRALEIRPDSGVTHRILADVLVRQGRLPEAAAALHTAIALDRWDWKAFNALGIIDVHLDRYTDGIARLEHSLWINPADQAVVKNLEVLRTRTGRLPLQGER
jgi:hypothetical protein